MGADSLSSRDRSDSGGNFSHFYLDKIEVCLVMHIKAVHLLTIEWRFGEGSWLSEVS